MTSVDMPPLGRDPLDAAARDDLRGLFELETVHRRGPASLVCLARDLEYNQPVALKIMPRAPGAGAEAEEGFHRAAALVAALEHPHVVPLYGAGATDRFFWCSMAYVEGRSLSEALRSSGSMEPSACLRLVGQVATALDAAHRLGVVHAGLTPANVLLDAAGDAHVTDFWMPWVLERLGALPGDGGKARRDKYRAPEQLAEGRCGPETDQYALAALMQACLVKTPARVPPEMARAVERALNPTPEARFPSVQDFLAALSPTGARPRNSVVLLGRDQHEDDDEEDDTYEPYAPPRSRWRWLPAGVLTLVALGAVATPWLLSSGSTADLAPGSGAEYTPPPADSFAVAGPEGVRPDTDPLVTPAPVVKAPVRAAPARRPSVAPPHRAPARSPRARPGPGDVSSLAAPGHLFISATPWGQLYVDGELIGNTPRADVQVAPGAHRLRVTRDGFQPYEVAVRVAPGQELRLTDIVLQEIKP
jgi:serine/threonine-protein kinase